jgi:hypothetical protein
MNDERCPMPDESSVIRAAIHPNMDDDELLTSTPLLRDRC